MVTRRSARLLALVTAIPLLVALSGCTPLSLFLGGQTPSPHATKTAEADPTPTPHVTPRPTFTPGCVDKTISQGGTYRIDDCENLTITGTGGIVVTAGKLGTVTLKGDSLQLYAQSIKSLDLEGQLNNVQTTDAFGVLVITGDRNVIASHGAIDSVLVNGNDNTVTADGGFGATIHDNGQRNTISANP